LNKYRGKIGSLEKDAGTDIFWYIFLVSIADPIIGATLHTISIHTKYPLWYVIFLVGRPAYSIIDQVKLDITTTKERLLKIA